MAQVFAVICYCFCPFLFSFFLFNLVPDRYQIRRNGRRYQHVLCAVLKGVILKGLTLRKVFLDVCGYSVCFVLCLRCECFDELT